MLARAVAASLAALPMSLGVSSVTAQAPSAWASIAPPGGVNDNAIRATKQLVMYRQGTYLRVFASATGKWHALPISSGTTPQLFDEILLVPESDRWTAFSAYRGVFEPLFCNWAATTMWSIGSCAIVRDGATTHVFSAFTGRWHTFAVPASWLVHMGDRYVAFTTPAGANPSEVAAIDVYTGQRHDLPAQPATLATLRGAGSTVAAIFVRPDTTRYYAGFSALRPTWVIEPGPGTAQNPAGVPQRADFLPCDARTFSGLTGTFATASIAPLDVEGFIAMAGSPPTHVASASQQAWTSLPPGAVVKGGSAFRELVQVFAIPGQAIAFNAVSGALRTTPAELGPGVVTNGAHVGAIGAAVDVPSGMPRLFSALTDQWYQVPPDTLPGMPALYPAMAPLRTSTGVTVFSARSGSFTPLAIVNPTVHWCGNVFAVRAGNVLHVFDARAERWLSAPMALPPVSNVYGDTDVMLAGDFMHTIAFGARSGRLESLPVAAGSEPSFVRGDVAVAYTPTHVHAFTGLPENLAWSSLPLRDTACAIGTTWRHQLRLGAGSLAVQGFGPRAPGGIALPPFGELWLDPVAVVTQVLAAVPGEERVLRTVAIPDVAALRGSEWWTQTLVVPAAGAPWLTDPEWLWVL